MVKPDQAAAQVTPAPVQRRGFLSRWSAWQKLWLLLLACLVLVALVWPFYRLMTEGSVYMTYPIPPQGWIGEALSWYVILVPLALIVGGLLYIPLALLSFLWDALHRER